MASLSSPAQLNYPDTFLREVAPQVKSAELIAEDNSRQNCISNISACFQQACKDTMDPNDPEGSYDLCLTRPETMLNLCQVPLNACGINTTDPEESDGVSSLIWDFVLARLQSMRVNSCTTQVKQCLQSQDRCGADYTQCLGLDIDTIIRLCPYDTLLGCRQFYDDEDIRGTNAYEEIYDMIQGVILNIDNNMLTECQNAANEAMIRVCGDTDNCQNHTVNNNLGAGTLQYKICEYTNYEGNMQIDYSRCKTDVSQISDTELGRVEESNSTELYAVTPLAGVIEGLIYWDNVRVDEDGRLNNIDQYLTETGVTNLTDDQRTRMSSELTVLQDNIDTIINTIEADQRVQYCMHGRTIEGGRNIVDRSDTYGQFPELTKQMRMIIANSALKAAKENYYKKYDELTERMMQDYVTMAERMAEIQNKNALDARREIAREACVNFAEMSSLAKVSDGPKVEFEKTLASAAVIGAELTTLFTIASADGAAAAINTSNKTQLTGSKQLDQWKYKETITSTFEWDTLICHKCTRTQQCEETKNPLFGSKYCKKWADPVETCNDTQF